MASKKKTTFAKLARERKLRERRLDKQAKKDRRKQGEIQLGDPGESPGIGDVDADDGVLEHAVPSADRHEFEAPA